MSLRPVILIVYEPDNWTIIIIFKATMFSCGENHQKTS